MNLEQTVRSLARRLARVRAAEAAVRWAFISGTACFAALVASSFGLFDLPAIAAAGIVAAATLAAVATAVLRGPDLLQVAGRIDRALDLKNRVATALEAGARTDPMARLQRADAARALTAADRRRAFRFVLSTEGRLLPLLFALCAGAVIAQTVRGEGGETGPSLTPEAQIEALRWIATAEAAGPGGAATADLERRLDSLTTEIREGGTPIDALDAVAREAADRIRQDTALPAGDIRRLKQIGRAARGAAAALARAAGRSDARPWELGGAADPVLKEAFGERTGPRATGALPDVADVPVTPGSSGRPIRLPDVAPGGPQAAPRLWDADYDTIIRNYFDLEKE